mgnify:CR=1 FL=1|jgi:hypothetical protein
MKITLSRRERILIIGSLIAIIVFVYMMLVMPHFKDKIEAQEDKLLNLRTELSNKEMAAVNLEFLKRETDVLETYLEAHLEDYFGIEMKQENVLLLVRDYIEESGIDAYELSLDEDGTGNLQASLENFYKLQQADAGMGEDQTASEGDSTGTNNPPAESGDAKGDDEIDIPLVESWTVPPLRMISVNIRFRSDYPSVMKFLKLISEHAKTIGIEELVLDGTGVDPARSLEGTIRIFLPALEMVETYYPTPEPEELEENLENHRPKADPFDHAGRYVPEELPPEETDEPVDPEDGD